MIKEPVLLPSQGFPYNNRIEGSSVYVKPITTRVYKDFITSTSDDGILNLVDSCLVDCPLKAEEFVFADLVSVYIKIRAISLGNSVKVNAICPKCGVKHEAVWHLDKTECNYLCIDKYPLDVELPESHQKVSLTIPTSKSNRIAKDEAKKWATKYNKSVSDFLSVFTNLICIRSSSCSDLVSRSDWYDNLPLRDAIFIDQAMDIIQDFGIVPSIETTCSECGNIHKIPIHINKDFFRTDFGDTSWIKTTKGTLEDGPEVSAKNE